MAKKGGRILVVLECTEQPRKGVGGVSRYYVYKSRNASGKLELRKYNPYLRRHTLHREKGEVK